MLKITKKISIFLLIILFLFCIYSPNIYALTENSYTLKYTIFLLPIFFLLICIFLVYKYGREDKVIETVEFYPPKGFNSLEVGFLYKGKADNVEVASLLIDLANKGYIKISEFEGKSLFSKINGFKIIKLKDYDGNNVNEKIFLDGLFDGSKTSTTNSNEMRSLNLFDTTDKIIRNINNKENKNKIFKKPTHLQTLLIIVTIILTYLLITIPALLVYNAIDMLAVALIMPGIGFSLMFWVLVYDGFEDYKNNRGKFSKIKAKIFIIVWGLLFSGVGIIPILFNNFSVIMGDITYLINYIIGIACILGMFICLKCLSKRLPYGNELLGKIKGFKKFIENSEKEQLEEILTKDPNYFYNIIPYAYVLGVLKKWTKKFESINILPPSWYETSDKFDFLEFENFISSTLDSSKELVSSSTNYNNDNE